MGTGDTTPPHPRHRVTHPTHAVSRARDRRPRTTRESPKPRSKMYEEITTRREAIELLNELPGHQIITEEKARELVAPFGIDYDDDAFGPLDEVAPMYWGDPDQQARGLYLVVHDFADAVGAEKVDGWAMGHGRRARQAFEGTLENVAAELDIDLDALDRADEPEAESER